MKKNMFKATCIALGTVLFFGCKKFDVFCPAKPEKPLRIDRIYGEIFSTTLDTIGTVMYNDLGNPVSIKKTHLATGNADYAFIYDEKNRLIQFLGQFPDQDAFEFWHFYKYDNNDHVIVDSIFGLGQIAGGRPKKPSSLIIAKLQYDGAGRITKYTAKNKKGELLWEEIHEYDAKGNRISASGTYDDKTNPHTLNKVWQFIDRDYSVNNPLDQVTSIQYNSKGLPVSLTTVKTFYSFLEHNIGGKLVIDYTNK